MESSLRCDLPTFSKGLPTIPSAECSDQSEMSSAVALRRAVLRHLVEVEGVLMEIHEKDLFILDSYEGYPELYSRSKLDIFCADNKSTISAWVYTGNSDYVVERNLNLENIQKERIHNGFKFLSLQYQNNLLKFML